MEYAMYSVKDELTGKFMSPMFVEKDEYAEKQAIRQFKSNLNNIKLWRDNLTIIHYGKSVFLMTLKEQMLS